MKYLGGTAERIYAKFTRKCLVPGFYKFEGQSHQGQKNGIFGHFGGLQVVNVW